MTFSRRSLYFIILSSINPWRTRCIDQQQQQQLQQQQQQQQQSVASAILATTQRSVRNTITLIITPTFRSASTFRLWGQIYMESVWDVDYAVLKDGWWIVDQYIPNDSLERRWKRLTKHCFSYCDFKSDSVRCVCFSICFMVWPVLLCSHTRYAASISLDLYLD